MYSIYLILYLSYDSLSYFIHFLFRISLILDSSLLSTVTAGSYKLFKTYKESKSVVTDLNKSI